MRTAMFLLPLALLVGCDDIGSLSDTEYVIQAEESIDKGELKTAVISLKNALRENPENSQARWLLGKLYLDIGNGPSAEKELNRARDLGVVDESITPLLARALIQQGKYQEVVELEAGSGYSNEIAGELQATRGLAYLLLGDTDTARRELDAAIAKNPNSPYVLVERARLSVIQRNFGEAPPYLEKAFEIDPDFTFAWSLQGDMHRFDNKPDAAIEAYTKALENTHNTSRDLQNRAMLYIRQEQYDDAQRDTDALKKVIPGHPQVDYVQGLIYFMQGKNQEAQESLEQCIRKNPDHILAVYYLGVTQIILGNTEQADRNLSTYLRANPGSVSGNKLLAVVKLRQKDFKAAEALIRPVVNQRTDDVVALNILAESLFYQGKIDELMPVLEETSAILPDSAQTRMRIGIGLMMQGENEAGIQTLESAIDIDPQIQNAELLLVLNYLRMKSYDKAQQVAEAFSERQPESVQAHNLKGMVYLAQDLTDQAEEAFEQARQLAPGDPFACRNLALLALKSPDTARARALYNEILQHHPGHLTTMSLLAAFEEREGEYEAMKTVLHKAIEIHPDAVTPRLLLARQYLSEGDTDQVFALLNEEIRSRHRNNPVVQGVIGQAELDSRAFQNAKNTYQHQVRLLPQSANMQFQLAKAYGGLNDSENMEKALKKTLKLAPDHYQASLALTRLWFREGQLEMAKQQLALLKDSTPNRVDVLVLEAEISARTGEPDKALDIYQKLFEASPDTQNLLRLTQLQWQTGNREAAVSLLEGWIVEHPDDMSARQTLAGFYMELDRPADGIAQYETILKSSADNPIVLNDMAWHLRESDPGRALELAEKASSIAPNSVSIMDTMAVILIRKGDTSGAQRVLDKALEINPESPTLQYRNAMLLEAEGKTGDAIAELSRLLKNYSTFPERMEADRMLERLRGS